VFRNKNPEKKSKFCSLYKISQYKKFVLKKKIWKHIPEKGYRIIFICIPFYLRAFSSLHTEIGFWVQLYGA